MCIVQIDGGYQGGLRAEIAHHIAAARSYGDDMVAPPDVERIHVHDGVFPDLRINQAAKEI